jgi:hypothetical protein
MRLIELTRTCSRVVLDGTRASSPLSASGTLGCGCRSAAFRSWARTRNTCECCARLQVGGSRGPGGRACAVLCHAQPSQLVCTRTQPCRFNTHVVLDSAGQTVASYRKIHLFDVDVPNGPVLLESRTTAPGNQVRAVCVRATPVLSALTSASQAGQPQPCGLSFGTCHHCFNHCVALPVRRASHMHSWSRVTALPDGWALQYAMTSASLRSTKRSRGAWGRRSCWFRPPSQKSRVRCVWGAALVLWARLCSSAASLCCG